MIVKIFSFIIPIIIAAEVLTAGEFVPHQNEEGVANARQNIMAIMQMAEAGQLTDDQRNNRIEEIVNEVGLHFEHYRDFVNLEPEDFEPGSIGEKLTNMPFEVWLLLATAAIGIDQNILLPLAHDCEALYLPGYVPKVIHGASAGLAQVFCALPNAIVGEFFVKYFTPEPANVNSDDAMTDFFVLRRRRVKKRSAN